MGRLRIAMALALAVAVALASGSSSAWSTDKKSGKSRSGGLSGQVGDVRYRVMFLAGSEGGCEGLYKAYVKASGHSAYASTPMDFEYYHCAVGLNAGSQQAAEKQALASCEGGKQRYKVGIKNRCEIYMSK